MSAPTFYRSPDMEVLPAGGEWYMATGGVSELMAACVHPNTAWEGRTSQKPGSNWTGTRDFAQADEFLRNGWQEGLEKIDELRAAIVGTAGWGVFPEAEHDVEGALVDVGAYVAGEPECMMRFVDQPAKRNGGLLRVIVNVTGNGDISADAFMQRGAAIVAMVDAMERGGKSVEIVAVECSGTQSQKTALAVTLKSQGEAVEMGRIAYTLGHPSFLRRHMFAVAERQSPAMRKRMNVPNGYGYAVELGGPARDALMGDGDLYIPTLGSNAAFDTPAKCREWIKARCAEQGVELEMAG